MAGCPVIDFASPSKELFPQGHCGFTIPKAWSNERWDFLLPNIEEELFFYMEKIMDNYVLLSQMARIYALKHYDWEKNILVLNNELAK